MKLTMMITIGALAVAAPALAQIKPPVKAMPGMAAHQKAAPTSTMMVADGAGVVRAVDATGGTVTIEHGPIAALKWPAMTMKMTANPRALLKGVSVGQSVKFRLMQMGNTTEVTAIRPN